MAQKLNQKAEIARTNKKSTSNINMLKVKKRERDKLGILSTAKLKW